KKMIVLHPGDQLWEYIAGGAGYGDPLDRDPSAVCADVLDGKISPAQALEAFAVVLTPDGAAVDDVKTKEARARRHRITGSARSSTERGIATASRHHRWPASSVSMEHSWQPRHSRGQRAIAVTRNPDFHCRAHRGGSLRGLRTSGVYRIVPRVPAAYALHMV